MTARVSKWVWPYFLLCYPWWKRKTWTIEPGGLVHRKGWISRHESRISWQRVQDINLSRGLGGRICGYGTITVETAGERSGGMKLDSIGQCLAFYNELRNAYDAANTTQPTTSTV